VSQKTAAGSAAFQAAGVAEAPIREYRLALLPVGTRGCRQDAGAPIFPRGCRKRPRPGAPPSRRQASRRHRSGDTALLSRWPVPTAAGKMPALPGELG